MAIADLKIGTVILPRSESPAVVSRLTEFEWFHKIDTDGDRVTPEMDDLLLEAQKTYQSIDDVVKGLQVPPRVGMLEILFKGTAIKPKSYEMDDIAAMVSDVTERAPGVISGAAKLLEESAETDRSLDEYRSLKEAIETAKRLDMDLAGFGLLKRFFVNLFIIGSTDYEEISRSLGEGVSAYKYDLQSKERAALLVIGGADDSDRILRSLRNFNAAAFAIPEGLPQVPSQAYSLIEDKLKELAEKKSRITKELAKLQKSLRRDILTIHEEAKVAKDVLETLRKPGGTRNFAVVQGYIPANMASKFRKTAGEWTAVVEEITDPKLASDAPTLFQNKRFVRTFEVITGSQGIPKKGEEDPTPMIAMMWPIFYGIMFADVGHGLLLMGMGLLFKMKGQGMLSRWGMLIAISGGAAAIAGVGAGEAFGYHIDHLEPFEALLKESGPLHAVSWLVGILSVAELTFEQVIDILKVSLFLGVVHLLWAMILRVKRNLKAGHKITAYMESIPNITLYGGIVVIMMCAIGAQYDVMNMYSRVHNEPVPWVTMFLGEWATVWIVTRISVVLVIASMATMMVGGMLHAKRHPEEGGSAANVIMEVFLGKTVESLAHTISYARIGIMLLVHAALLLTVNNAYASMGGAESVGAWAMIIGGNLGIMMIEGLIVYIQALRLHLYEFFTKWYDGGAQPFRAVRPELIYNQFRWKAR